MEPEPDGPPKPTLRDSVANLSEELAAKDREIASLKSHVAELEAARDVAPAPQTLEQLWDAAVEQLESKPLPQRAREVILEAGRHSPGSAIFAYIFPNCVI